MIKLEMIQALKKNYFSKILKRIESLIWEEYFLLFTKIGAKFFQINHSRFHLLITIFFSSHKSFMIANSSTNYMAKDVIRILVTILLAKFTDFVQKVVLILQKNIAKVAILKSKIIRNIVIFKKLFMDYRIFEIIVT